MDHDSIAGALEFIEAGRLLHLPVTIGLECRVSLQGLPFSGRHINNPDQRGVAYIALHGVPHHQIPAVQAWLEPIRQARFQRSLAMNGRLNHLMKPYGLSLDFEQDIIPLSCWKRVARSPNGIFCSRWPATAGSVTGWETAGRTAWSMICGCH
jgi:hypothetical protein